MGGGGDAVSLVVLLDFVLVGLHPRLGSFAKDPKSTFKDRDGQRDLLIGRATGSTVPILNDLPDMVNAGLTTTGSSRTLDNFRRRRGLWACWLR